MVSPRRQPEKAADETQPQLATKRRPPPLRLQQPCGPVSPLTGTSISTCHQSEQPANDPQPSLATKRRHTPRSTNSVGQSRRWPIQQLGKSERATSRPKHPKQATKSRHLTINQWSWLDIPTTPSPCRSSPMKNTTNSFPSTARPYTFAASGQSGNHSGGQSCRYNLAQQPSHSSTPFRQSGPQQAYPSERRSTGQPLLRIRS